MDRDEVSVHKLAKKRTRPISSHLDRTNLVNKGFIIWLLVKFCFRDAAGSPERARWLHLARSGSQSQRAIWFILPAHGTSHIIRENNALELASQSARYIDYKKIPYNMMRVIAWLSKISDRVNPWEQTLISKLYEWKRRLMHFNNLSKPELF